MKKEEQPEVNNEIKKEEQPEANNEMKKETNIDSKKNENQEIKPSNSKLDLSKIDTTPVFVDEERLDKNHMWMNSRNQQSLGILSSSSINSKNKKIISIEHAPINIIEKTKGAWNKFSDKIKNHGYSNQIEETSRCL